MRVLIVEDDVKLARLLKQGLEEENYAVLVAADGTAALNAAEKSPFEAVVLDVMLPVLDGFSVARKLRAVGNTVPILMLTARDANADIVRGLDAGADDYLTKPFAFEVLLARLRALTRRNARPPSPVLRVGELVLDPSAHEVRRGRERILLTRTEFNILECLMRRAGRVVPRQTLIEEVWGYDRDIENNTLDAFIRLLRSKVDVGGRRKLIHTVRGVGFSVREES